jgi:hypothetical protein
MKIAVDYNNLENEVATIIVVEAFYDSFYKIKMKFNDNSIKIIDFEPFLSKSNHPSISKYLDLKLLQNFKIEEGNLNWNDYDLIFPVRDLYEGKII